MSDNEDDTYHFSSEDIGCKIYCVVTYEPEPNKKQVECLSFGHIELAPYLRNEIENNLISNSCMYSTLVRTNPKGDKIKNKGIRVNTKSSIEQSEASIKEYKSGRVIQYEPNHQTIFN